jgi:hypothetical protein
MRRQVACRLACKVLARASMLRGMRGGASLAPGLAVNTPCAARACVQGPVDVAVSLRAGVSPALDATPNLGYVGSCIELTLDMCVCGPGIAASLACACV